MQIKHSPCQRDGYDTQIKYVDENTINIDGDDYTFYLRYLPKESDAYSSAFIGEGVEYLDSDICIDDNGERHFNLSLQDMYGNYLYSWNGSELIQNDISSLIVQEKSDQEIKRSNELIQYQIDELSKQSIKFIRAHILGKMVNDPIKTNGKTEGVQIDPASVLDDLDTQIAALESQLQ